MSLEIETKSLGLAMEQPRYMGGEAQVEMKRPGEGVLSEAFVGNLLRYGVFVSIAVCALGAVLFFMDYGLGGNVQTLTGYSANPAFPHTLGALGRGIAQSAPLAIIAAGLLLLVALRVIQVLLSAAIYGVRKNYKFVFISLFVFAVLMSSLFLGKAGG